ncbi:hypothetical protein [uncultured Thiohalocapsa sp.]|nr:hypothetical protein [uncultured Thiohalocapsa sp.]
MTGGQVAYHAIGGWTLETLHAAERIASDTVQGVAEWSVLYSKEVPDT